jgi:hypothetical protein
LLIAAAGFRNGCAGMGNLGSGYGEQYLCALPGLGRKGMTGIRSIREQGL